MRNAKILVPKMATQRPWINCSDLDPTVFVVNADGKITVDPDLFVAGPGGTDFACADLATCSLSNIGDWPTGTDGQLLSLVGGSPTFVDPAAQGTVNFTDLGDVTPTAITPGALYVGNAAGDALEEFPAGGCYATLSAGPNGGNPTWGGSLVALVSSNILQTFPSGVDTKVIFNVDGSPNPGNINNNEFVAPCSGIWRITGRVRVRMDILDALPSSLAAEFYVRTNSTSSLDTLAAQFVALPAGSPAIHQVIQLSFSATVGLNATERAWLTILPTYDAGTAINESGAINSVSMIVDRVW